WSRSRTSSRRSWGRSPTGTKPSARRWSGSGRAPPPSRPGLRGPRPEAVPGFGLTAETRAGRRNKLGTVLVQLVDAKSELSRTGPCLRPSRPHYTLPGERSAAWSRGREDHHAGPVDPRPGRVSRGRGSPRRDRADLHRGVGRAAVAAAVRAAP